MFNQKRIRHDLKSERGDRMRVDYQLVYNDEGQQELKKVGMTDIKEEIESHGASVDINNILMRVANGDSAALDNVKGFYADVTDMPLKLQDVLNINARGKEIFDNLPKEQKKLYDNNYINFVNEPEKLIDYLSGKNKPAEVKPAEVKPVEKKTDKGDE